MRLLMQVWLHAWIGAMVVNAVNAIDFAWEFFALDRRECADDYAWVAHLRRSIEI
jgi:hypothetical protein